MTDTGATRDLSYHAGLNSKDGNAFIQGFLDENNPVKESRDIVLVLMRSEEMDIIVEEIILGQQKKLHPELVAEDHGAFWWIKAPEKIEVDCDLAQELLGKPYNVYDFLVNVSSTVGRAFINGNTFTITTELMGLDVKLT